MFPLYCSSTELEASLDFQQRAEKRLTGWEGGDTTWLRRETARKANTRMGDGGGLGHQTQSATPSGVRKGLRGNRHSNGFPTPSTHLEATV